jgi:hypothetical protein
MSPTRKSDGSGILAATTGLRNIPSGTDVDIGTVLDPAEPEGPTRETSAVELLQAVSKSMTATAATRGILRLTGQPFNPLRATLVTICRWAAMKRISTGTLAITAPAIING